MNTLLELPLASATALDQAFNSKAAMQKYRRIFRREIGEGVQFSLGRAGTVQLASVPVVACLATAGRWNLGSARRLARVYKNAGLSELMKSTPYRNAMELVRTAMQRRIRNSRTLRSSPQLSILVAKSLAELTLEEGLLKDVAVSMAKISTKVDEELDQIKRLPGHLVRIDGHGALVVVNTGEREELRLVDSAYLSSFGIHEQGQPFVMYQLSWSPDTTTSVYFPALDVEARRDIDRDLAARLKAAERPLPEPAEQPEVQAGLAQEG